MDKLESAALLSPVAYLIHMTTPVRIVAAISFSGEVSLGNLLLCMINFS